MQTITFECETITPMFLAGADGVTPELRAPSIKGSLRFWWRAMNGHLTRDVLQEREGLIFGNTSRRSCFSIQTKLVGDLLVSSNPPVPHRGYTISAVHPATKFQVVFRITPIQSEKFNFDQEHLTSLFEISIVLGGIGKRVRRGMGSYCIKKVNGQAYQPLHDCAGILQLMQKHTQHYQSKGETIVLNHNGAMLPYPWISRIAIGQPQNNITRKISDTTHDMKSRYGNQYEPNLGHAFNGRFASPVFVSVLSDGKTPVFTFLNTVPDRDQKHIDVNIQKDFFAQINR